MKRIQFKHIVVGCMLAALLAVPTMAFAAPSADDAAASDPAVVEQQDGVEKGTDTTDDTDADAPEDGAQNATEPESGSNTPVYYYIVGGCVVALGIGFYIALTVKQKKR